MGEWVRQDTRERLTAIGHISVSLVTMGGQCELYIQAHIKDSLYSLSFHVANPTLHSPLVFFFTVHH